MVPEKILRNGRIGPIIEVAPCPRDFPTEILVLIIQYLSKSKDIFSFSRVKKSWYSVAYEKLWEYVEISSLKSAVHFRDILRRASFYTSPTGKWTRILKRIDSLVNIFRKSLDCPRESRSLIQRTNTVDLHDLSDSRWHFSPLSIDPCNSLLLALANLPNLRSLVLPKCRITKPMQILSGLKGLEELDLTFCRGGPDGFLDRLLHAIAKNCHRLRKLKFGTSLCMDPSLSHTSALAALGESCPLTQFSMLLNDPKVHMHSSNLSLLFRTCHKLEKVDIQQLCCTEYRFVLLVFA